MYKKVTFCEDYIKCFLQELKNKRECKFSNLITQCIRKLLFVRINKVLFTRIMNKIDKKKVNFNVVINENKLPVNS